MRFQRAAVCCGVPHGSISCPLLSSIYTKDISRVNLGHLWYSMQITVLIYCNVVISMLLLIWLTMTFMSSQTGIMEKSFHWVALETRLQTKIQCIKLGSPGSATPILIEEVMEPGARSPYFSIVNPEKLLGDLQGKLLMGNWVYNFPTDSINADYWMGFGILWPSFMKY